MKIVVYRFAPDGWLVVSGLRASLLYRDGKTRIWQAQLASDEPPLDEIADAIVRGVAHPAVERAVELSGTALQLCETEIEAARLLQPFLTAGDDQRLQWTLALQPRPGDAERVFQPRLAALANQLYPAVWSSPSPLAPNPGQSELRLGVSLAESIVDSGEFPGGYRDVADQLRPGFAWVAWKFVAAGESAGLSFDGLVRIDDRFVWFPRPWKLLSAE